MKRQIQSLTGKQQIKIQRQSLTEKQQIEVMSFVGWCSLIIEIADSFHNVISIEQINPNIIKNQAKNLTDAIDYVINKFYAIQKPPKSLSKSNPNQYQIQIDEYQKLINQKDSLTNEMMDFNLMLSQLNVIAVQVTMFNDDKKKQFQEELDTLLEKFNIDTKIN